MIGSVQVGSSEDAIQAAVRFINTVSANPEALQAQLIQLDESAKASLAAKTDAEQTLAKLAKAQDEHDKREAAVSQRELNVAVLERMQADITQRIEDGKQVVAGVMEVITARESAVSTVEQKFETLADSLSEQVAAVRRILDK